MRCLNAAGAALLALALALSASPARAQTRADCDYATCALRIAPRLSGLDIVRGDIGARAGSLGFLWPSASLTRAFDGDVEAQRVARASVRRRRMAAALTDAGALILAAALVRTVTVPSDRTPSAVLGAVGAATLAVSIPVQFAADEQLSRAVHAFNRRFAR